MEAVHEAVPVAGFDHPEHVARVNPVALPYGGGHRQVGGA